MNTQYFEFIFRKEYILKIIHKIITSKTYCAHLIEKYIMALLLISFPVNFVTK